MCYFDADLPCSAREFKCIEEVVISDSITQRVNLKMELLPSICFRIEQSCFSLSPCICEWNTPPLNTLGWVAGFSSGYFREGTGGDKIIPNCMILKEFYASTGGGGIWGDRFVQKIFRGHKNLFGGSPCRENYVTLDTKYEI